MKLVITGGPKAGKTKMFKSLKGEFEWTLSTDSLIGEYEWSALSLEVSRRFERPGPWLIEGVAAVRALRKWLAHNPTGKPCDVVVYLDRPHLGLTSRQEGTRKACRTIWLEIRDQLHARGVRIEDGELSLRPFSRGDIERAFREGVEAWDL